MAGRRCRRRCGAEAGATAPRSRADRLTREAIFALFPYPRRLRVAIAPLRLAQRTGADRLLARSGLVGQGLPRGRAGAAARAPVPADVARAVPGAGGGARPAARGGRDADRVRAVGVLSRGQRGDRAGARGRGVRRDHPARAGVLRRAVAALRAGGRGGQVRQADDRDLRGGRRGRDRRQLGRVRVGDEGVRAAVRRTGRRGRRAGGGGRASPALPGRWRRRPGRPGGAAVGRVRDFPEFLDSSGRSRSGSPVAVTRGLPRRLPPGARAADHRRAALAAARRSPGSSWWNCGTPGCAAVRRASTTCCSRKRRGELGSRKADSVVASGASLLISANPGCTLQISAELAAQGVTMRTAHTAEVLDASINGVPLG